MTNYTHVVFDIDGTLLNTQQTGMVSLQKTVKELLGVDMSLDSLYPYFGIPSHKAVEMLHFPDVRKAGERWEELFQELMFLTRPFEGVEELLENLHQKGTCMGIITSRSRLELETDAYMSPWMPYFTCTVCAEDCPRHKPAPDPMLLFLDRTGARPDHTLYIGDTLYDQQCAHSAGTHFALACWGAKNRDIPAECYLDTPLRLCNVPPVL